VIADVHETESWTLLWYPSRIRTEVASQQRKAHTSVTENRRRQNLPSMFFKA